MSWGILGGVLAISAGFAAMRAFRFRRLRALDDERLARKDDSRRQHHFRGNLDFEMEQGPQRQQTDPPQN
ncbi:MAG TPA: hypothetical protein VGF87_05485 [Acidimicrobiales bacterium]|jgi:hypothetical protein